MQKEMMILRIRELVRSVLAFLLVVAGLVITIVLITLW